MKIRGLIFGIGLLVAVHSANADPPLATDDPETPPPGGWEINIPLILERAPGRTDVDSPLLDLNYGLPSLQLKAEFPIKICMKTAGHGGWRGRHVDTRAMCYVGFQILTK